MSFASNFTVTNGIGDDQFFHDGRTVTPMIPAPSPSPYDYGGTYGGGWVGVHSYSTPKSGESLSRLSRTGLIILPILISVLFLVMVGLAVLLVYRVCCVPRARSRSMNPRHHSKTLAAAASEDQTKTFHNLRVSNGNEDAAGYPASYASTFAADGGGISSGGDFGAASSGGGCTSGDAAGGGACGI